MKTYLYLDDAQLDESRDKVSGLSMQDVLYVKVEQNLPGWKQQMERLKNVDYDGLILDLKLDELPIDDGQYAGYRGTTIAQLIRDYQKEGTLKAFPMLLFSGEDNMKRALDNTGRDLFDMIIEKGSLNINTLQKLPRQLAELSECYKRLNGGEDARNMIKAQGYVDERFMDALHTLQTEDSNASCVRFLLNEFLLKPGLLIDETLLAARLGVDKDKSGRGWNAVLKLFEKARYDGIFGESWARWWMRSINTIWKENTGTVLQQLEAEERIDLLKKVLGCEEIVAATKTKYAEGNSFWAVCCGTGKPLDPIDGFEVMGQDTSYPWQDLQYVSKEAAFHKIKQDQWNGVATSEKERLEYLKQQYEKKGER